MEVVIGESVTRSEDGYDFVDFSVSIRARGLSARSIVRSAEGPNPLGLTQFLRRLAEDWRGEAPPGSWEAIEHELLIEASRDPLGHVVFGVTLRESYRTDAWSVHVSVVVEAGEEMSTVARDVEALLVGV